MSLAARLFRWHRWLGYAVALQVLAWVLGGVLFAWLPFQGWVKSADLVRQPQVQWPAGFAQRLAAGLPSGLSASAVQGVATAQGPALRLKTPAGERWFGADGGELPPPDEALVAAFARSLYQGPGRLAALQRLDRVPTRLGIVTELHAAAPVWVARFDDAWSTRIYVDSRSGELLAARNEAWVWYDFFWRLHVMDYAGGEDFNNPLLRAAAPLALGLVLTGGVLLALALSRRVRARRRGRAPRAAP